MAPNLLLQKWPAPAFVVTAALKFTPMADGDTAGLIVFGQDYAWLGLTKTSAGLRLEVSRGEERKERQARAGGRQRRGRRIDGEPARGRRHGGGCRFGLSVDNRTFTSIGEEFMAKPGQWVGAKVGLFAVARRGAEKTGFADWNWFRVTTSSAPAAS